MARKRKYRGPVVPLFEITSLKDEADSRTTDQSDGKRPSQREGGKAKGGPVPILMGGKGHPGVPVAGHDADTEVLVEPGPILQRRLNIKLLVVLPIVLGSFGVGAHFLHAYQVERSADVLYAHASKLLDEQKPKQSIRYLRQYVGFRPDDVDALSRLAETLQETAKTPRDHLRAYLTFEQVLRRDGSRSALRREQVQQAIRFGRRGDARVHLDELLGDSPEDGELRFFAGVVDEADRHFEKSAAHYRAAISRNYKTVDVYVRLARILRERLEFPDAADRIVDAMVQGHPKLAEARLARAVYRKRYGTLRQALEEVAIAQELDATSDEALLLRVGWTLSDPERSDVVVKAVREMVSRRLAEHPREPRLYAVLSLLELQLNQSKRAVEVLQLGRETLPDEVGLVWPLAEILISEHRLEEAKREISRLQEMNVSRWIVDYLTGRILYESGKILSARSRLELAMTRADRSSSLWKAAQLLLGQCYRRMGAFHRQLDICGQVVDATPLSVRGRLGMAEAYGALGRTEDALKIYVSMQKIPAARFKMARLLFARNRQLPADKRDWQAVEAVVNTLAKDSKYSIEVELMRAELFVVRGQRKRAVEFLTQLQKHQPKNVRVRCGLARLAIRAEYWDQAEKILARTRKEVGDSVVWRITQADLWRDRSGAKSDGALDQLEQGLDHFSVAEQLQVRGHLAEIQDARGDARRASRLWQQIATTHPHLIGPRFRRFLLAYDQGDRTAMQDALSAMKTIEGRSGLHVAVAKAAMLIHTGQDENRREALAMLKQVRERRPNWALVYLLRATVFAARQSNEAAAGEYRRAIELGLRSPKVVRRTFQLLYRLGHYREMDQLLTDLGGDTPASVLSPIRRAAAAASLKARDFKRAVTLARRAVQPDSTIPAEHIWLGQVYLASGRDKDAEREFRKAVAIAPEQPGPRVVLIQFFMKNGRREEAEQAAADAVRKLHGDNAALALGLCHELVGELATAEQYYQKALSKKEPLANVIRNVAVFYLRNHRPGQAVPLLHRLIDQQPPFPESSVHWARRSLAEATGHRDYRSFIEALSLLDRNLNTSQNSVPDLLVKARMLASHSGIKHRRDAMTILEKLASQGALAGPDQNRLAILYDVLGLSQTADNYWKTLLKTRSSDPTLLAAYVRRELQEKSFVEAERWWKRLDTIAPQSSPTVELHTRLLVQTHHAADAVNLLQTYIQDAALEVLKRRPDETERIRRLTQATLLTMNLSATADVNSADRKLLHKQTETWFRDLVPQSPQSASAFAGFLARLKRTDDAFNVLDSVAERLPPLQVAAAGIAVIRDSPGDVGQINRIEHWLDRAMTQRPRSTVVLLRRAELRIIQKRYDDAILLYQTVLEIDSHHPVALNNLAWHLSLFKGQHTAARKLIDQAIESVGPVAVFLETRGSIRLNQDDGEGAIRDFKEVLQQSESSKTRFRLAQAQSATGHRAAAALNLRKAIHAGLNVDQFETFERKGYLALSRQLKTNHLGPQ